MSSKTYLCHVCEIVLPPERVRVHCQICLDFNSCAECHVLGVTAGLHSTEHDYEVLRNGLKVLEKLGTKIIALEAVQPNYPEKSSTPTKLSQALDQRSIALPTNTDFSAQNVAQIITGNTTSPPPTRIEPSSTQIKTENIITSSLYGTPQVTSGRNAPLLASSPSFSTTSIPAVSLMPSMSAASPQQSLIYVPTWGSQSLSSEQSKTEAIQRIYPSSIAPLQYWGQVITPPKTLSPLILRLVSALFDHFDRTITPKSTGWMEPSKFIAFKRAMGVSVHEFSPVAIISEATVSPNNLHQVDAMLSALYYNYSLDHQRDTRQFTPPAPPAPVNGRVRMRDRLVQALTAPPAPTVYNGMPKLSRRGFTEYIQFNILLDPTGSCTELNHLLNALPPLMDYDIESSFQHHSIPRECFPAEPDSDARAREDAINKRIKDAEIEAKRREREIENERLRDAAAQMRRDYEANAYSNEIVTEAFRNMNGTYTVYGHPNTALNAQAMANAAYATGQMYGSSLVSDPGAEAIVRKARDTAYRNALSYL